MIVYRICKRKYANDVNGKGAELVGGRWNSKGFPMIYTSESRALCTLEVAVHLPLGIMPKDFCIVSFELQPKASISTLPLKKLPSDWSSIPHSDSTQKIGDLFLKENKYLALQVPSAIVSNEFNYLINPFHKQNSLFKITKIENFTFDERLI